MTTGQIAWHLGVSRRTALKWVKMLAGLFPDLVTVDRGAYRLKEDPGIALLCALRDHPRECASALRAARLVGLTPTPHDLILAAVWGHYLHGLYHRLRATYPGRPVTCRVLDLHARREYIVHLGASRPPRRPPTRALIEKLTQMCTRWSHRTRPYHRLAGIYAIAERLEMGKLKRARVLFGWKFTQRGSRWSKRERWLYRHGLLPPNFRSHPHSPSPGHPLWGSRKRRDYFGARRT